MMRRASFLLAGCALLALSACESTPGPSETTGGALIPGGSGQTADRAMLAAGRELFVGRCAKCHALPNVAAHSAEEWPGWVAKMAKRSGLKPGQSESVLSFILHQRKQG